MEYCKWMEKDAIMLTKFVERPLCSWCETECCGSAAIWAHYGGELWIFCSKCWPHGQGLKYRLMKELFNYC
jgi:hypothetical protein